VKPEPGLPGPEPERAGWRDLIGLDVSLALKWARDAGYETRKILTQPPWPGEGRGSLRVLRIRPAGPGILEFVVAAEGYTRDGRGDAGQR